MRVNVPQRLMLVPVRVPLGRRQSRMLVQMVAVVVPMAVDVGEPLVGVEVFAAIEQSRTTDETMNGALAKTALL